MTARVPTSRLVRRPSLISVILWVGAFIWVVPILWTLSLSLTPNETLRQEAVGLLPVSPTLDNFIGLFSVSLFPRWLLNSAIVSVGSTVGLVTICSLAGYALSRMSFRGRRVLFVAIMAGLMIPDQAVFLPRHVLFSSLGLSNTYLGLSLPRLALPLGVFLMFQFFRAIPRDLEEAAALDGAGSWTKFTRIILPLSRPALVTLGIFGFIQTWNDFLWPLVSTNKPEMYTVTIGLASLQANFAQTEGLGSLMATAVVTSVPILLVFLVFQRFLIEGVRGTARF